MEKVSINPCVLLAPLPVALVTCGSFDEPNVLTIAWTGVVCSDPPRVYISVRPSRHSHKMLIETGEFVINLTDKDLTAVADFCGFRSGRDVDKFAEMGLVKVKAQKVSPPLIEQSKINLECKIFNTINLGSHDMFIADVVAVNVNADIMIDGKVDLARAGLINYQHGEYYQNGKHLARFGFAIQRKFIKENGKGTGVNTEKATHTKRRPPRNR